MDLLIAAPYKVLPTIPNLVIGFKSKPVGTTAPGFEVDL